MIRFVVGLGMLALCTQAIADVIVLTNGNRIEGQVADPDADPLVVNFGQGYIELPADMVQEVIPELYVLMEEALAYGEGEFEGEGEGMDPADHVVPELLLLEAPTTPEEVVARFDQLAETLDRIALGESGASPAELALKDSFLESVAKLGPDGVSSIQQHISQGHPGTAADMLRTLKSVDAAAAKVSAGQALTKHVHPQARMEALNILSTDQPSAIDTARGDEVWYVRERAYQIIAGNEDVGATRKLIEGLDDPDEDVRESVTGLLSSRAEGASFESKEEWLEWWSAQPGAENVPTPAPIEKRPSPDNEPWPFD